MDFIEQPRTLWQDQLKNALTSAEALRSHGLISVSELEKLRRVSDHYQVRLTPYYASLIEKDPTRQKKCPIWLQAIPQIEEENPTLPEWARQMSLKAFGQAEPWRNDAIGDLEHLKTERLTHRYENRALIHVSPTCAMYCRFCFRKSHLNDHERNLYQGSFEEGIKYLTQNIEIKEVILTGGDPLSLTDAALKKLLSRLDEIKHLKIIRFHTRMPVTLPQRITPELIEVLKSTKNAKPIFVTHFNHPKELTPLAMQCLVPLIDSGIPVFNQSVLLRGINNSADLLEELFSQLYFLRVIPYYLHHADWTPGTLHFRTSIEEGQKIMRSLKGRVPGPAYPDYVLDIPGGFGKISLLNSDLKEIESKNEGSWNGKLWELTSPHTKKNQNKKILYAELWKN